MQGKSAYGALPPEGGKIGFIGIAASGREGARENTGNFLHGYAARHILGQHATVSLRNLTEARIEEIRARHTHLAFVAATSIMVNNPAPSNHDDMADAIARIGLPVVVFGLGSQAPLGQSPAEGEVAASTRRLLHVLSDHAPSIAVRGAFTGDLCRRLGIRNVEVVGCQSCFMSCRPDFRSPDLAAPPDLSRSIVNFTRHAPEAALMQAAMAARATVIGQSGHFEYDLVRHPTVESLDDLPDTLRALLAPGLLRMFEEGRLSLAAFQSWMKTRFHQFYSMPQWFDFLARGFDFTIGTRFHGNMTSMQAGIPALWVVHDMRTREFCDLLGLPHVALTEVQKGLAFPAIVERHYDPAPFNRRYAEAYARFHAYLERQGVPHRLAKPTA